MSILYWITILDNLKGLSMLMCALSLIFSAVCFLINLLYAEEIKEGSLTISYKSFNKAKNWVYTILIISTLVVVFVPSENQLYKIYGIGGTIDYLKENPTAKELPDKCIKALDTWLDNINKEENNE